MESTRATEGVGAHWHGLRHGLRHGAVLERADVDRAPTPCPPPHTPLTSSSGSEHSTVHDVLTAAPLRVAYQATEMRRQGA